MKSYNIAILKGDGIGPEIVDEAIKVLDFTGKTFGFSVNYTEALIGGSAIDTEGVSLPEDTITACKKSDAVLLGAVGGPKWERLDSGDTPEAGLLGIRKALNLFANLRPSFTFKALQNSSPLKVELLDENLDLMIVRELVGGIYFGDKGRNKLDNIEYAFDTERYTKPEIQRIAKVAFELSSKRNKKLCSVDKANVLMSSRLWRETLTEMAKAYRDVELTHMYVDNCAMQLINNPKQFDVIVTSNLFGDILSDEASMITGSLGMLPSASLGEGNFGLYEPVHGSAPDIANKGIANPLATILSVAMMLKYSLGQAAAAESIEKAVQEVLKYAVTEDIYQNDKRLVNTKEMGILVREEIAKLR